MAIIERCALNIQYKQLHNNTQLTTSIKTEREQVNSLYGMFQQRLNYNNYCTSFNIQNKTHTHLHHKIY